MNLSGLNIVCLEEILECLNLVDLLSAADTCKRLRHTACLVYARKYGRMLTVIQGAFIENRRINNILPYRICYGNTERYHVDTFDWHLKIRCSKIALQLLRCFGHLIPHLNCFYHENNPRAEITELKYHCIDYINEFCSETLGTLKLDFGDWNRTLDQFSKPFKQVERLGVNNLGPMLNTVPKKNCLPHLFPRMQSLVLLTACSPFLHNGSIAHHFSNLQELSVEIITNINSFCEYARLCLTCKEIYRSIFRLNPQLTKLEVLSLRRANVDMLIECIEHLQNLQCFVINARPHEDTNVNFDAIHLKSVRHLKAVSETGMGALFKDLMLFVRKFTFDRLESFTLHLANISSSERELEDFCKKNQSIQKLGLIIAPNTVEHALRIRSWLTPTLPSLNELEFTLIYFLKGVNTKEIVVKTVRDFLVTFNDIPCISFNFTCPVGSFSNANRFHFEISRNEWIDLSDVWSASWTDYKRKRLSFKRILSAEGIDSQ